MPERSTSAKRSKSEELNESSAGVVMSPLLLIHICANALDKCMATQFCAYQDQVKNFAAEFLLNYRFLARTSEG